MDFYPSFQDKSPNHSRILQENPTIRSEIPIIVPLQQTSTIVPPLKNNTTFMYQDNFHNFHHQPLNGANHHLGFVIGDPSSLASPFSMIPMPPSGNPYANGSLRDLINPYYPMAYSPNKNKMKAMHDYLNNVNGNIKNYSPKILIECAANSLPHLGPSFLPPTPLVYGSTIVKPRLQDELSSIVVTGNNSNWGIDQRTTVVSENKEQKKKVQRKRAKIPKNNNIIKGQWTPNEDRILVDLVKHFGLKKWSQIAEFLNGRGGKQCRERWHNHLRPNIKKDKWTEDENKILVEAHQEVGNKWAEIARRLPGRAENTIKNHWNATKRRLKAKRPRTKSKGALLQNYIMQVTAATAGKGWGTRVFGQENDDIGRNPQPHVPITTRNGCYRPMILNVDEMASASATDDSTIDYEDAIDMDNMVMPEKQLMKEMDLMDMICRKP